MFPSHWERGGGGVDGGGGGGHLKLNWSLSHSQVLEESPPQREMMTE